MIRILPPAEWRLNNMAGPTLQVSHALICSYDIIAVYPIIMKWMELNISVGLIWMFNLSRYTTNLATKIIYLCIYMTLNLSSTVGRFSFFLCFYIFIRDIMDIYINFYVDPILIWIENVCCDYLICCVLYRNMKKCHIIPHFSLLRRCCT